MLTQKQERFCLNILEDMTQREAWIKAGYSSNYPVAVIDKNACVLAKQSKIQVRIKELRDKAASAKVANYQERQEILSEIARGRLSDFIECGQDGSWINIDKDKMNTAALQAIDSKTEYDDNGAHPTVLTKIRLHSPAQAIDLLNKMDKVYEAEARNIYNDIKIVVIREPFKLKELNGNGNKKNTDNHP